MLRITKNKRKKEEERYSPQSAIEMACPFHADVLPVKFQRYQRQQVGNTKSTSTYYTLVILCHFPPHKGKNKQPKMLQLLQIQQ